MIPQKTHPVSLSSRLDTSLQQRFAPGGLHGSMTSSSDDECALGHASTGYADGGEHYSRSGRFREVKRALK